MLEISPEIKTFLLGYLLNQKKSPELRTFKEHYSFKKRSRFLKNNFADRHYFIFIDFDLKKRKPPAKKIIPIADFQFQFSKIQKFYVGNGIHANYASAF